MAIISRHFVEYPVAVVLEWFFLGVATCPIWGSLLLHVWEYFIRPRFVPKAEIVKLADALIAAYGADAEERARMEENHAWRRCDAAEQGVWKRVRREMSRR